MSIAEAGINAAGKVADVVGKVVDRKTARDAREEAQDAKQERVEKITDAHDPKIKSVLARWGYAVRLRLSRGVSNPGTPEDRGAEGGGATGTRDSAFKRLGSYFRGGAK